METILVATDFSGAAHYGVELAGFLNAKVVLVYVDQPIFSATGMASQLTLKEIQECYEGRMRQEIELLTLKCPVTIETIIREGSPSETIHLEATKLHAKWIIAGMKGSGKTRRRFFGSTALSLSRGTHIPLIVIPEDARFTPPKTIALASDIGDGTEVEIIDPLEEFGIKFNSKMYIVRVIKKGMDDFIERLLRPTRVTWHCAALHPSFEFLNDNDVAHALNEFVKENDVSMVAMIAHEHTIFDRIFAKSNIKEMMFSTYVPLIILPGKAVVNYVDEPIKRPAIQHV
jgi:nucleotide-binding universal stress UspA family protein